jgi:hypothetical protein
MNNTLLWIDDERQVPEGFTHWAKTSQQAIDILSAHRPEEGVIALICFDHDLGYDPTDGHPSLEGDNPTYDDTRRVVEWMVEHNVWPEMAIVHSHNPIGATWLENVLRIEGPQNMTVVRQAYTERMFS